MAQQHGALSEDEELTRLGHKNPGSPPKSQRVLFEQAWGAHEPNLHPDALKLHVERRTRDQHVLSFREMCGESAFIPPSELMTVRKIGSGSFAKVEICKYNQPGKSERTVAVKRLTSQAAVDIAQFASEANILRKLVNENIVGYIGVGSSEESGVVKRQKKEQCYLVQEFINGGSLKAKIWRQSSSLSPLYSDHDAVQWGQQIAEGLAYLHSANPVVLHRDLKLENILLNDADQGKSLHPKFTAKICDFGLAVSILDPYFGYRQDSSELPGGLVPARIDSEFHEQMKAEVRGGSITHRKLASASRRLDEQLKQPKSGSVSRTSLKAGAQPVSPRSPTSPSSRVGTKTMSKTGGVLGSALSASGEHEAYLLTGRAGSFLYMAPEVVMCQPYNEKADVFSLGVILFELFLRKTLAAEIMEMDNNPGQIEMFAYKIAGGHRHPIPRDWPEDLRQLIDDCWQQDPDRRPTSAQVAKRLGMLESAEVFRKWEEVHSKGMISKCCSIQ